MTATRTDRPLSVRLEDLDDQMSKRTNPREPTARSPGIVLKRDLRRYYDLLDIARPQLPAKTVAEAWRTWRQHHDPFMLYEYVPGPDIKSARFQVAALQDALERAEARIAGGQHPAAALRSVGIIAKKEPTP